jgi:phospholipid/cholesterol/gamma-HCH transport system ATP-binding protein
MVGRALVDERSAPSIELEGVQRDFGSERVLDGVDLAVPAGAITVLLGPSGAGKTVTINHILGLLQPSAGSIRVAGRDLAAISEAELNEIRRRMGVVQQGSLPFTCGLFYSLNVYENVAFPLRERTRWSEKQIRHVTLEHLGMVGMREYASHMPDQLSAGMAKRVALARALALDAQIVIVDDFDSGIDGVRLALLCELIAEAQRSTGATFLVTTHNMTAARTLADHVAVIHQGRIVASGAAEAVFGSSEPLVRQLLAGDLAGPLQLRDL